jgi:predicted nucleic acid-binding protein
MRALVVDASVSLKWAINDAETEPGTDRAMALLAGVFASESRLMQPSHWLAEMAGVLSRRPETKPMMFLADLSELGYVTIDGLDIIERAITLSQTLRHHLFDTLYHAVALASPERVLVTADDHYYRKAASFGQIMRLSDWPPAA